MINKKDIEKLIVNKTISNLRNHWFYASLYNFQFNGEVRENEILIWKNSKFLRNAYPIFVIFFDKEDNYKHFKTINNPYHIFLQKIIFFAIIILIAIVFLSFDLRTSILGSTLILLLSFAWYMVIKKSIAFETKILIEDFNEVLIKLSAKNTSNIKVNIIEKKQPQTKQWTFYKILARVILYPFCAFIFYWAIELIKNGKIFHGFATIIISGAFILSDLLIIFKMEKNKYIKKIIEQFK